MNENCVPIANVISYIWQHHENYPQLFRTSNKSNFTIEEYGDPADESFTLFTNCEVEIDGRKIGGVVKIVERLSQWYSFLKHNPKEAATINIVLFSVADIVPRTLLPNVIFVEVDLPNDLLNKFNSIKLSNSDRCIEFLTKTNGVGRTSILESLAFDRIIFKYKYVTDLYNKCSDWNRTFNYLLFDTIAIGTPFRSNFQTLAAIIYTDSIIHTLSDLEDIEALLFGAAGLLTNETNKSDYLENLQNRYKIINNRYRIKTMDRSSWESIRSGAKIHNTIARLATLLHARISFTVSLSQEYNKENIYQIMRQDVSTYWQSHDDFSNDTLSTKQKKQLPNSKIDIFIINAIIPTIFAMHCSFNNISDEVKERTIDLLMSIKGEKNGITDHWSKYGLKITTAYDSQAIIHLQKYYCSIGHCHKCSLFQWIKTE